MAHIGKYGPYGPCRDLGGVSPADMAVPPPNRLSNEVMYGWILDSFFSDFERVVSEPIFFSYDDGTYGWEWNFTLDAYVCRLRFWNQIYLDDPDQQLYFATLKVDDTDYGPGVQLAGAWDAYYQGIFNFEWPNPPEVLGFANLTFLATGTLWADTP